MMRSVRLPQTRTTIQRSACRAARSAFSLIEILVVIAIITVLVALVVAVTTSVFQRSEEQQTEITLKLLDQAVGEWRDEAEREITWGLDDDPNGARYDMQITDPQVNDISTTTPSQMTRVIRRVHSSNVSRQTLGQINPNFFTHEEDGNGNVYFTINDAWDNPIYVVHPGRVVRPDVPALNDVGATVDEDGTIRVEESHPQIGSFNYAWEQRLGVARNRQMLFVSAGPDGQFGNISAAPGTADFEQTQDNIYSYQPERP